MQIDKTTYNDLSVFNAEEEFSVFHKLNFTRTGGGKEWLRWMMREPFEELNKILDTQKIIQLIVSRIDQWPTSITNGTMMMMERFYDTALDPIPHSTDFFNTRLYKALHSVDYGLVRYSVTHFRDFVWGMQQLAVLIDAPQAPAKLQLFASRIRSLLLHQQLQELLKKEPGQSFSIKENLYYGYFLRNAFKTRLHELSEIFYQLDAWYSMARAVQHYRLTFPEFVVSDEPFVKADKIYHILLPQPVSYDIELSPKTNFLFLTGANMAGKSTFIKSLGVAVYLAHLGMGVPAEKLQLSLFDGILSNINVEDNIVKGESYFFNEVQRIKKTILTISNGKKWLVLIDELFKGTNMQDAMRCSLAVIKGLIRIKGSLFILSTHLYEIGDEMKVYPTISFKYFETNISNDKLEFSYQLKDGISNDRLGYFILKSEKVVELLEQL
ncbi:MutS-related protein [Agriterribacter humi]|uniref:MutS-related protein n=1 Tax=Agriterribacter humi TaxID=1104781 RepID=UPI0012642CAA|nr:DNA mismatch repair protein MutS [Agriterribacter humi]